MTTLAELLCEADKGSEGLLSVRVLEIVDMWLSWWERDALDHVKWCQKRKISAFAALGRYHQIQEIRQGLTDKQFVDVPNQTNKSNTTSEKT